MNENLIEEHKKHRKRLKKMFKEFGLENFGEHNIADIMLSYSTRSDKDSEYMAETLISKYSSAEKIFDAPYEALLGEEFLNRHQAILFKLIPEITTYLEISKNKKIKYIKDSETAQIYLKPYFSIASEEMFAILYLGKRGNILKLKKISGGSQTAIAVDLNIIIRDMMNLKADKIVIAHNHPFGFAIPSREDIIMTEKLSVLCRTFSYKLCEHIIFSENDSCLLSHSKRFRKGTFSPYSLYKKNQKER